jgi:hypothetical protein
MSLDREQIMELLNDRREQHKDAVSYVFSQPAEIRDMQKLFIYTALENELTNIICEIELTEGNHE